MNREQRRRTAMNLSQMGKYIEELQTQLNVNDSNSTNWAPSFGSHHHDGGCCDGGMNFVPNRDTHLDL